METNRILDHDIVSWVVDEALGKHAYSRKRVKIVRFDQSMKRGLKIFP